MHLNVQCIRNKIEQLEICLFENKVDIVCISEQWLNVYEVKFFKLNGYKLAPIFRRQQFKNGGVAVSGLKNFILESKEISFIKSFWKEKILEIAGIEIKLN